MGIVEVMSASKKAHAVSVIALDDLRHEAISRFFELGLSVPEVALISGHRDPRMLFRYTHLRADDLAQRLRRIGARIPCDHPEP